VEKSPASGEAHARDRIDDGVSTRLLDTRKELSSMSDVYRAPTAPGSTGVASGPAFDSYDEGGGGWVAFAGVMILIVGVMNVIYGIAALDDSSFFVQDARYVIFDDLNTWGWVLLIVGAIQCLVALGIWARNQFARWLGVFIASVNAIVQLLFLPASPFLALALFSIDLLVVFGLIAYGGRRATA
jgi:hypothetical protein